MVEIFTKDLIIHTHTFRGSLLNKKKCSFTHLSWSQGQPRACLLPRVRASVFMNVEELGYFIEIFMLLTVLNNLLCYWHPVEDVPQHDPHHHFVPEVEDDTFAVVLPLGGDLGDCRVAGRNRDVRGLRLCLAL